jgi:REP element-mobilizing transposase RayT
MTQYGIVVDNYINKISEKYKCVNIDKYVIMPNHIHLLISIYREYGTGNPSPTVGNIIGWLKYNIIKIINQDNKTKGINIFQRSFHNHIIRNKNDYEMIWHYIDTNPQNWEKDDHFVENSPY